MKQYKKIIFIFRRDLRLPDNRGLMHAASSSALVIPIFILDPRQIDSENNYRSMNCLQFMFESLADLHNAIAKQDGKLYIFHGIAEKIIDHCIKENKVDAVFVNADYTPFSIKRDQAIKNVCEKQGVHFFSCQDALLNDPTTIKTKENKPYSVFTAFYKRSSENPVVKPIKTYKVHWYQGPIKKNESLINWYKKIIEQKNKQLCLHGGRTEGLKIVKKLKNYQNYATERDFPIQSTTHLSAHLKFGTVSAREVYYAIAEQLGPHHPLLKQLYWRDFFSYVAYYTPSVFGHAFHKKYEHLWWSDDKKLFDAWCAGQTGFPIVDAGMRQLNTTGFMHNRVRMIVASFLTKDLHIDWRWGERYFAQQLVDYDPAVNNGNWQWCASTGCDAQPYFRIFNPWLQQKKFDTDCAYIKKWVSELRPVAPATIHTWYKPKHSNIKNYPRPIIKHDKEVKKTKLLYKKVAQKTRI